MSAKSLARVIVLTVALTGALLILSGKVSFLIVGLAVIVTNGAVVSWLRWHEEQSPEHRR